MLPFPNFTDREIRPNSLTMCPHLVHDGLLQLLVRRPTEPLAIALSQPLWTWAFKTQISNSVPAPECFFSYHNQVSAWLPGILGSIAYTQSSLRGPYYLLHTSQLSTNYLLRLHCNFLLSFFPCLPLWCEPCGSTSFLYFNYLCSVGFTVRFCPKINHLFVYFKQSNHRGNGRSSCVVTSKASHLESFLV